MKECPTCKGKGVVVDDDAWNFTLQELKKCPDCDTEPKEGDLVDRTGLVT